jgi:hypothetical protein
MSYYREKMRCLLSQRAGDWLRQTRNPRLVAIAAISLSMLTFAAYAFCFFKFGIQSLGIVLSLSGCLAYLTFVAILAIWLYSVKEIAWQSLVQRSNDTSTGTPYSTEFDRQMDDQIDNAIRKASRDSENMIELMVFTAIFGIIFIATHFTYHSPYYLGQLLFDCGKIQHRISPPFHMISVICEPIRQSWLVCFVLVFNFGVIGVLLDNIL